MEEFGTCDTGCSEQKLELVRAAAYDSLTTATANARARAVTFGELVATLARQHPSVGEFEAAYRSAQQAAREHLRRHPDLDAPNIDAEEPPEAATAWWCPKCGGIDAPQPCLEICIWRPIEWVNRNLYEQERERSLSERKREHRLQQLLCHVAWVTPHPDQWERSWRLVHAEAVEALDDVSAPAKDDPDKATASTNGS
jgi:hypothetical protein